MREFMIMKQLKNICLVVCLFVTTSAAFGQQKYKPRKHVKIGGAIELTSPGNSHGAMVSPVFSLNKGCHSFFAAAFVQKRSSEFVGGRAGYSFNLTDGISRNFFTDDNEDESYMNTSDARNREKPVFHLNGFVSAQYYHQALLSRSSVNIETRTSRDKSEYDWSGYRMSTVEVAVGAELNFRFSKRITWKNTVGVCVYNHLNYDRPMYAAKVAPTLMLGTGIHICPL